MTLPRMRTGWEDQASQYAPVGPPGITLVSQTVAFGGSTLTTIIDCLLYRNEDGLLLGILNHFTEGNPFQKPGSCNLWVKPGHQRQGIASALLREAWHRWHLKYEDQDWTTHGDAWLQGLVERGKINPELTDAVNETFDWKMPPPGVPQSTPVLKRTP